MRLVSLNTWKCDGHYARRLQAMVALLRPLAADVIALQEVFSTPDGTFHTSRHLARALGLHLVDAPARAKPRSVDGQWRASHSGLAVLSRWPVRHQAVLPLPTSPDDGERLALCTDLDAAGQPLRVCNVHLTHLPGAHTLRQQQWTTVLDHAGRASADSAVLVCGDLNSTLDDPALRVPMAGGGWYDAVAASGLHGKHTLQEPNGQRHDLDHVLARPHAGLRWHRAAVLSGPAAAGGVAPSDHAAVWVQGSLAGPGHRNFPRPSNNCHTVPGHCGLSR